MAARPANADLTIGDAAPALNVSAWVKGTPMTSFDPDKVYVVEFWATWCGPCKVSIPHLTEMAKHFGDKVRFNGISVWERGDNIPGMVTKFVNDMGDKMDYNVALDNGKTMAETWMQAANQNGIPAAFVIQGGKIVWIGHPMDNLDKTLESILAGKYDMQAFKTKFEADIAKEKEAMAVQRMVADASAKYNAGKKDEAEKAWSEAAAKSEDAKSGVMMARLMAYSSGEPKKAEGIVNQMSKSKSPDAPYMLLQYSRTEIRKGDKANRALADKAANAAIKMAGKKDPYVYYLAAMYSMSAGVKKDALARVNKAIEMTPTSEYKDEPDFMKMLTDFKARVEKMP